MPVRPGRPVPVFVCDDTVSIRQLVLAVAVPGFPLVFSVPLLTVQGGPGALAWASCPSCSGRPAVLLCADATAAALAMRLFAASA